MSIDRLYFYAFYKLLLVFLKIVLCTPHSVFNIYQCTVLICECMDWIVLQILFLCVFLPFFWVNRIYPLHDNASLMYCSISFSLHPLLIRINQNCIKICLKSFSLFVALMYLITLSLIKQFELLNALLFVFV